MDLPRVHQLEGAEEIDPGTDRAAWLAARRKGIGSSDAAAIIGYDPYGSALKVYADKLGLRASGDDVDTDQAAFGRWCEGWIVGQIGARLQIPVQRNVALYRNRKLSFLLATPDGFGLDEGELALCEAKSTIFEWGDVVPPDIWCQVQHQLAATELARAIVGYLNRETCEFRTYRIARDSDFISDLLLREEDFWKRLTSGEPPDPDASESCRQALKLLYPKQTPGQWLNGGPDLLAIDEELEQVKAQAKALKVQKEGLENQLIAKIGNAEGVVLPSGYSYSNRRQHRDGYIVKATEFRVLRRHKPGKGR